ncbi:ATP-binding cassette domain-containing protein [Halobellus ordinarius]|uniref:ATP-binding cassette domain-containing protein n=1 Tax=Halobellus ordinarius TaxID=3075120 RepID=UPI0028808BF3|nr:ATP-binding cassette domain-containing protein [Halobellus sp. ZY16]
MSGDTESGSPLRTSPDPLVEIADLRVGFGDTTVLAGIDATVDSGTFLGLIGPNGAGKTTLLRTLNGTLGPDTGGVTIGGRDVHTLSSKAASRLVATVPQDTTVTFEFDARSVVEMGRNPHRSRFGTWREADTDAVDRALDRTDTRQFADRPITTLSGGERQRVLLARSLAQETPLLLLDEPTASLDINHQIRTLELVRKLVATGKTVIAAIHDLNLAAHYCDELLLLADGDVGAHGPPASVLTESTLEDAFDANAVVSRHPVTGSVYVTALPDGRAADSERAAGRVHVVGGGGTAARHLYVLDAAGFDVSVGALNEGDTDTEAARSLGLDVVTVDPFAGVDPAAREAVERRIDDADCVVVADVEVGTGNLPNLRAAASADEILLIEERPFSERNYVGPEAEAVYDRLRERGRVVDPANLRRAVVETVGGTHREFGSAPARREGLPTDRSR